MPKGQIQSVERAIQIMEHLAEQSDGETTLSAIAGYLNVSLSTTHHLVATLFEHGLLTQDPHSKRYRFGPKAFWLSSVILGTISLLREARIPMSGFVAKVKETITLSILDGDWVLALDRISPNGGRVGFDGAARRAPVYCTAVGKVLVSSLPDGRIVDILSSTDMTPRTPNTITTVDRFLEEVARVRVSSLGIDREEWLLGTTCLATPILDYTGQVVAGLSCGGTVSNMHGDHLQSVEDALREVSHTISVQLGYRADIQQTSNR